METELKPVAGRDYPKTWSQFLNWFHSESACLAYLEKLRWQNGFVCPKCGGAEKQYRASRSRIICTDCGHQATVTAGTIFDKTRTELRVWFAAAWYITSQKHGVSALGMQRVLGLGSYQTAWAMMHRFRQAMVRPDREKLLGKVEVDETFIAIADRDAAKIKQRSISTKVCVVVGIEILEPKGFGRIRLRRASKPTKETVIGFIRDFVEPGSTVHTDGAPTYLAMSELGYEHERTVILGSDVAAHESLPGVHRVASLLKRWLLGTHHGAVQPKHLDGYLNEFTFRFNRRKSRSRGLLFYSLLRLATEMQPIRYRNIAS